MERKEIRNRVCVLFKCYGADKAIAVIDKVTDAIVNDFERIPGLADTLDSADKWNYYITQTAFSI